METFLVFYASPRGEPSLNLDKEIEYIDKYLELFQNNQLHLVNVGHVKKEDLHIKLMKNKPAIVQFSGHGTDDGEILLEDANRRRTVVAPKSLEAVFKNNRESIKVVLLNCCYSTQQAKAIAKHIPFVIGMNGLLDDLIAPHFSSRFLGSIAGGLTVQQAFDIATAEIGLIDPSHAKIPKLLSESGFDANNYYLFPKPKIFARFLGENDIPDHYRADGYKMYKMKVYIMDYPEDTASVFYQYMDVEWELDEQIESIDHNNEHFRDFLDQCYNLVIRATMWSPSGGIAITSYLVDALRRHYGDSPPPAIEKAIREIKKT